MANPVDMILPMLREMRTENLAQHEQTRELIAALERRLGVVESTQKSFRTALSADSLLSKLVTGEYQERIEDLERRVRVLESR